jgi:hypothetical protein
MDPENRIDEDDSGLLEPEDSLDDRGVDDVLDEGYSPPERPLAVDDWGTTADEEAGDEPLDARLAREQREAGDYDSDYDGLGDSSDTAGELFDDEVGDVRAGRLVASDQGGTFDDDDELYATDVGIDGAASSAEEAAVHVVAEESPLEDD